MAALPDIIGSTIGNMIAARLTAPAYEPAERAAGEVDATAPGATETQSYSPNASHTGVVRTSYTDGDGIACGGAYAPTADRGVWGWVKRAWHTVTTPSEWLPALQRLTAPIWKPAARSKDTIAAWYYAGVEPTVSDVAEILINAPSMADKAIQGSLRTGLDTQVLYAIAGTLDDLGYKDAGKKTHAYGTFLGEQKAGIYRASRDGFVGAVDTFGNLGPVGGVVAAAEILGIDVPDILPNANKVNRPLARLGSATADYGGEVVAGRRDLLADTSSLAGAGGRAADKRYLQPLRDGHYEAAAKTIGGDIGYVEGTVLSMVVAPGSAPARGGVIATRAAVGGGEALTSAALTAERAAIATERAVASGTARSEAAIGQVAAAEAERALPQAAKVEARVAQANAAARAEAPVHRGLGDLTRMETLDLNLRGSGLQGISAAESTAVRGAATVEARGGTYVLRDAEGTVVRSGRTNDLARREAEHLRDPDLAEFQFEPAYRTDVYAEQRGLEQILHNQYSPTLNKIRPISPSNPKLPTYMDAAQKYLLEHGGP